jgi:nucleoside-diphosphate-sugar epimerase
VVGAIDTLFFYNATPALAQTTHLLVTAPPDAAGDPVLRRHGAAIGAAPRLRWIGYLSTTGVYGDRAGGWVDEQSPPAPRAGRSERRRAAELAWAALGERRAVDLFRIAGIYGPGRAPFAALREGSARCIDKPGHVFSRIHRDDITAAVCAAMAQAPPAGVRVFNLADDEPAEAATVTEAAAALLGLPPPPRVPYAEAAGAMSEMARSFWAASRRVRSAHTQATLGLRWRYPSYREGLAAILRGGED